MKCQNLFSGKKKEKNIINLPSAELVQRFVKVKKSRFNENASLIKNVFEVNQTKILGVFSKAKTNKQKNRHKNNSKQKHENNINVKSISYFIIEEEVLKSPGFK